jgi:DNA topoisomerase II
VLHEVENIYVPEMIFGHLLTSSNYDDDEKKVTGGRNGYGAKLANIFSTVLLLLLFGFGFGFGFGSGSGS